MNWQFGRRTTIYSCNLNAGTIGISWENGFIWFGFGLFVIEIEL